MTQLPSKEARERMTNLVILPGGIHEMKVTDVTAKVGYESGEAFWRVIFEAVNTPGGFAAQNYSFADAAWPYTKGMLLCLGFSEDELGESMEPEEIFGLTGSFRVATRRGGRPSNRIVEPILESDEDRLAQAELVAASIAPKDE